MKSLSDYFLKEIDSIPEEVYRFVFNRKALVTKISNSENIPKERLLIIFDEELANNVKTFNIANKFLIYYNIYTDNFIFERLLDIEKIERIIENKKKVLTSELQEEILKLKSKSFEYFVFQIISSLPNYFNIRITQLTRDNGVDFVGNYYDKGNEIDVFGQAKFWQNKLASSHMREFVGSIDVNRKEKECKGIIICIGGFTKPSIETCKKSSFPIECLDLNNLSELMLINHIGVKVSPMELCSIDKQYWENIRCFNY